MAELNLGRKMDGNFTSTVPTSSVVTVDEIQNFKNQILAKRRATLATDYVSTIRDDTWVKQAFTVDTVKLNNIEKLNRTHSSAVFKFNDTSLGGSYAINPRPQFTPYADIRVKSLLRSQIPTTIGAEKGHLGLGRYYSEAHDDNAQVIHMRFGVPVFNSLTQFFTGFYNRDAGNMAKTGRITPDFFSLLGKVVGTVVQIVYVPILAINALGSAYKFFFRKPTSKFYYLKPTMLPYWLAVNGMVNQIATNRGLYPRIPILGESASSPSLNSSTAQEIGTGYRIDTDLMKEIAAYLPDIFSEDGTIDVYAAGNKAMRLKVAFDDAIAKDVQNNRIPNFTGYVKKLETTSAPSPVKNTSISQSIFDWMNSDGGKANNGEDNTEVDLKSKSQKTQKDLSETDSLGKYFRAEWNDGASFASFKVDYTGPVSESFSNSATESDIAQKINGMSSSARSARFSFADGNISDGAIGKIVGGIGDALTSFAGGVMDSINVSGLFALGGSAFVDIPKHWDSSHARLPQSSYTMTLISPYGNVISQLINIYIPLSMIVAGTLPLSTGKQSHTSPFLLELYDRGRAQTRLGMIDSLSITRGTSNLGFNKAGNAMAVEVSFTVLDLSSVMSMPISPGFSFNPLKGVFDDDNAYTDYINVLSSLNLAQQIYVSNKFKLNLVSKYKSFKSTFTPSVLAGYLHTVSGVGDLDVFMRGQER